MFSKQQKAIIIFLTVTILVLGGGIYLNRNRFFNKAVVPVQSLGYERVRSATASLSSTLKWEQAVGGSADETLVGAFSANGKIYIFGNTNSSDFDMEGIEKGFLAILSANGETVNFLPISASPIEQVSIAEGGFLAVTASPSAQTLLVNFDGEITKSLLLNSQNEKSEKIILMDGGYAVLSSSATAGGKKLLFVTFISNNLELIYKSVSNEAYSMSIVDAYAIGGQIIAFCHASGADERMAVSTFCAGTSPVFRYVTDSESYIPYRILPYEKGWVVCAIDALGQAYLLKLSHSLTLDGKLIFNIANCKTCDMRYQGGNYFVFVTRNDGGFFAKVNGSVTDSTVKSLAHNFSYYNDYKILRALDTTSGIVMGVIYDGEVTKFPLTSAPASNAILVDNFLVFQGQAVFGGQDVVVSMMDV